MQEPDNSLNSVRLDCEIFMTPDILRNYCSELNALHAHSPLNSFAITDKQNPVDLRNEQQKDQKIATVLQWLATGQPSS